MCGGEARRVVLCGVDSLRFDRRSVVAKSLIDMCQLAPLWNDTNGTDSVDMQ
jgi:hypothetical protein